MRINLRISLFSIFLVLAAFGCSDSKKPKEKVEDPYLKQLTEKQIGDTNYYISIPINVMCMPDFNKLQNAGVKRISMGNFLNNKIYQYLGSEVETVLKNQNFSSVF